MIIDFFTAKTQRIEKQFIAEHGVRPMWFHGFPELPSVHKERCLALIPLLNKVRSNSKGAKNVDIR